MWTVLAPVHEGTNQMIHSHFETRDDDAVCFFLARLCFGSEGLTLHLTHFQLEASAWFHLSVWICNAEAPRGMPPGTSRVCVQQKMATGKDNSSLSDCGKSQMYSL